MEKEIFVARYVCAREDGMPLSSNELVFSTKEKAVEYISAQAEEEESVWFDDIDEKAYACDSYIEDCGEPEYDEMEYGWHIYSTTID